MMNQYLMLITSQKNISLVSLLSLISLSSLLSVNPAHAFTVTFDNTDFESDFDSWATTGDTSIQEDFESELQYLNKQGFITTGCPDIVFLTGQCFDQQDVTRTTPRKDDPTDAEAGSSGSNHFNYSGNDQVNADGKNATGSFSLTNVQDFLGLAENTLNIDRENGSLSGTRTPKEGSAIRQTITVDSDFTLSFNWHFLTNDTNDATFGDRDYAFVTIYDTSSSLNSRTIDVLADASSSLVGSNTSFTSGTSTGGNGVDDYDLYTSSSLPAGTYVVGLGVVDVDGVEDTSGLLVDNFQVQQIPFEFSPTGGIALMLGLLGCDRLRRRIKINGLRP